MYCVSLPMLFSASIKLSANELAINVSLGSCGKVLGSQCWSLWPHLCVHFSSCCLVSFK